MWSFCIGENEEGKRRGREIGSEGFMGFYWSFFLLVPLPQRMHGFIKSELGRFLEGNENKNERDRLLKGKGKHGVHANWEVTKEGERTDNDGFVTILIFFVIFISFN